MIRSFFKFLPAAVLLLIAAGSLCAQDLNFPGIFPSLSLTGALNEKMDINVVGNAKIRTGQHTVEGVKYDPRVLDLYGQVLLFCKINSRWQIGAGYGFQRNDPFLDDWRNEHRLLQQVIYNIKGKKLRFYNRFRVEERWFSFPDTPGSFGTRVRYQAGIVRQLKTDKIYWQLSNDIYVIPSGPRHSFLSENWLYTGVGFVVKPVGRFETGIGYNSTVRNDDHDLTNLLLIHLNWSYIIPSTHKREINPVINSGHL